MQISNETFQSPPDIAQSVQEDKVCSTHCIASFSPRCDSFTRFDGSVRLHGGEPVSEGVHYSLLWFSVNERYLRQLNEDLRAELITVKR